MHDSILLLIMSANALSSKTSKPSKLLSPRRNIIFAIVLFSNISCYWVAFPMVPFLLQYFISDLEWNSLGAHSWKFSSCFALGQLLGYFVWIFALTRTGKRILVICSLSGSIIATILLGFSPHMFLAVLSRFLMGLSSSCLFNVRSYAFGAVDDVQHFNGIITGTGQIIGIAVGGLLCQPYLIGLHTQLFQSFPYGLPCLIISMVSIVAIVLIFFELNETLSVKRKISKKISGNNRQEYIHVESNDVDDIDLSASGGSTHSSNDDVSPHTHAPILPPISRKDSLELLKTHMLTPPRQNMASLANPVLHAAIESPLSSRAPSSVSSLSFSPSNSDSGSSVHNSSPFLSSASKRVSFNSLVEEKIIDTQILTYSKLKYVHPEDKPIQVDASSPERGEVVRYSNGSEFFSARNVSDEIPADSVRRLLLKDTVFMSICYYALTHAISYATYEVLILWLVSDPEVAGFDFDIRQISYFLLCCLPLTGLSQYALFQILLKKYGLVYLYRVSIGVFSLSVLVVTIPKEASMGLSSEGVLVSVGVLLVVIFTALTWALTCINFIVLNSCYRHQRMYVIVISEIMAAFMKSLFSCFFANTFAWSLSRQYPWPFNFAFVFGLLSLLAFQDFKLSGMLPKALNRSRREPVQPRYAVTMVRVNEGENEEDEEDFELSSRIMSNVNFDEQKVTKSSINMMTDASPLTLKSENDFTKQDNLGRNSRENIGILIDPQEAGDSSDSRRLPFV